MSLFKDALRHGIQHELKRENREDTRQAFAPGLQGAQSLRLRVEVDASEPIAVFRRARREARRTAARAMARAAEQTIVPEANRVVPTFAKGSIAARNRGRASTLQSRLPARQDRVLGLLEYGGTVRTPIKPKRAQALKLRDGSFVAGVEQPRTIKRKRMIQGGVERRFTDYQDALLPEIMRAFDGLDHTP